MKQLYPASVRMVLSGDTELETVTEAINQGAIYRYLTKPWDARLLQWQPSVPSNDCILTLW